LAHFLEVTIILDKELLRFFNPKIYM